MHEMFIKGPPGTGKTSQIKANVGALIDKTRVNPDSIALVSFTNTAANALGGARVPKKNIGTLHSFAFRAIKATKEQVAESHIDDFNAEQPTPFQLSGGVKKASPEYDMPGDVPQLETSADELFNTYQILRAKMTDRQYWPSAVVDFANRWESWKATRDFIDFTDMIELARWTTAEMPGAPAHIFADEAQDFAPLEKSLLLHWARNSAKMLYWVGDADQILYEFKGVDPASFIRDDLAEMYKRTLRQSHRVPRKPHAMALKWISRVSQREPVEYLPTDRDGAIVRTSGDWRKPEPLLKQIEKALNAGQEIMIAATCAYMVDPVVNLLRREGIPFHNPMRPSNGAWNPLSSSGTTASDRILAFLRPDGATWKTESRMWNGRDLQRWSEVLKADGVFIRGAKTAIEKLDADQPVEISDMMNWFDLDALEKAVSLDLAWFRLQILEKKLKPFEFPFRIIDRAGGSAAKLLEDKKVKVGTIHSFKGDEADVVILFPDLSLAAMKEWERVGPTRDRVLRQFYVGITRTRDKLIIPDPASNLAVKLV